MSVLSNVELVMWSPQPKSDPPRISTVRASLLAHGYSADHAEGISYPTAFRRAVNEHKTEGTRVVFWKDREILRAQLDVFTAEGERGSWERRETWSLNGESVEGRAPLDMETALNTYTWADVSEVLQSIFKKTLSGAYSPRRAGGIYFVPVAQRSQLDSLESACRGICLNLLRYQVPDTDAQRSEVASALSAGLEAELSEHGEAISAYTSDTRLGIISNRAEAIQGTLALATRLNGLLGDAMGPITARCQELLAQTEQARARAQVTRPTQQGRRVLTSA